MNLLTLLIVVIVIVACLGGGWRYGGPYIGTGGGLIGVLVLLLILRLLGII